MDISEIIRTRRTVELFRPDVPPREVILRGLDLARWAPNHKHTEPWQFHLIGPQTAAAIVELNTRLVAAEKGADAAEAKRRRWSGVPGWLAVTAPRSTDRVREQEDYAACCCSVQNLSLYLWSQGIAMKWSTGAVTRHSEFYRLISVDPAERNVVGLFWYGFPSSVPEQRRKPLTEVLREHP
jgi:nitroreductase